MISDREIQLLKAVRRENGGFHLGTKWYLRGFEPLGYQYAYHQAQQMNTTFLAGIAAGKTITSAASVCMDCLSIPYFRALNTSVTAKQAELPFDMFMMWHEGNDNLKHHIYNIKLRPWPIITFTNYSEWEFRTSGADARFIRGSEYDRIVYDEAGLDFLGETPKILRGRLRGTRPDGTTRHARLDVITSPSDAPWLVERFWRGIGSSETANLRQYLSFKVRTRDNTTLTEEQIALMEAEYTPEMIAVEMDAEFPDYGQSMFPKRHIIACTDQSMNDMIYLALNPEDPTKKATEGYVWEEHPRYGVTKFELPFDPRGSYIMAGDPGVDDPPRRNSPSVGVLRVDTSPHQLVYFDWIFGRGDYKPFLSSYKYAIQKYRPHFKALDTTATQKGIQQLAFDDMGISTHGVNFSRDKEPALNALSLMLSNHEIVWPSVTGLIKQMSNYTRESDKKIAQDIVMMLAMLAFGTRFVPQEDKSAGTASKAPRNRKRRARRRR